MRKLWILLLAGALPLLTATTVQADNSGTQHFGPFPSATTDGGSCHNTWALDKVDRSFTVHDNGDGTFRVTENFTDGTFVTIAGQSPGACEGSAHHGHTLLAGIQGTFRGFLSGTVISKTYNPAGCMAPVKCDGSLAFVAAVFGPAATFSCFTIGPCTFNFEYASSDSSLEYHHWQDKSSNTGEQFIGDIANS